MKHKDLAALASEVNLKDAINAMFEGKRSTALKTGQYFT